MFTFLGGGGNRRGGVLQALTRSAISAISLPRTMSTADGTKKDRGHPSKWSRAQNERLKDVLPELYNFGMVKHRDTNCSNSLFTRWKKAKARELLKEPIFHQLPEGVSDSRLDVNIRTSKAHFPR
jgi:hypothetical protein